MPLVDTQGRPLAIPEPGARAETLAEHVEQWMGSRADAIRVLEAREDRWVNPFTHIGGRLDKTTAGHFDPVYRLWDPEIVDLVNGSDIAAKFIEAPAFEMFRRGFELSADGLDASAIEDFREWSTDTFSVEKALENGSMWGSAFGGVLLILGLDDGQDPWEPLDEDRCRGVKFINQVDRRFAYAQSYYSAMDAPKYGQAELYLVSNGVATSAFGRKSQETLRGQGYSIGRVHESRCVRFDGNAADVVTQQLLAGWSWSILQRPYDILRQFDHVFDSAAYLLSDASQGVLKLQGLVKAMAAGKKQELEDRIQMFELTRGVARAIAIDAGGPDGKNAETFERTSTPFSGIPEMLDRMMQRLCAAGNMPVSEVFGRGAGGINAAGEAEASTRKWYDRIASLQQRDLTPKIKRLFRFLAMDRRSPLGDKGRKARWQVKHHPLWCPTDLELSQKRLADAQRTHVYIDDGVIHPEVAALAPDMKEMFPALDTESIEASVKAMTQFDPYENEPEPPDAGGAPGVQGGETPSPVIPMPMLGTAAAEATPGPGAPELTTVAHAVQPKEGASWPTPQRSVVTETTPGPGEEGASQPAPKPKKAPPKRAPAVPKRKGPPVAPAPDDDKTRKMLPADSAAAVAEHQRDGACVTEDRAADFSKAAEAAWAATDKAKAEGTAKAHERAAAAHMKAATVGRALGLSTYKMHEIMHQQHLGHAVEMTPHYGAASPAAWEATGKAEASPSKEAHAAAAAAHHEAARLAGSEGMPGMVTLHNIKAAEHDKRATGGGTEGGERPRVPAGSPEGGEFAPKGDAHDPAQPRDEQGRLSEHEATAKSRAAHEATEAAKDATGHYGAVVAHAAAASARRELAQRHLRLGNDAASASHLEAAAEHDAVATRHLLAVGALGAAGDPDRQGDFGTPKNLEAHDAADDQPRVPAGQEGGGQFASKEAGEASARASKTHGSAFVRVIPGDQIEKGYGGVNARLIHQVHEYDGSTGLQAIIHRTDGIAVYKHTTEHLQQAADKKFAHAAELSRTLGKFREGVQHDLTHGDTKTRALATVASLIDQHVIRVGGNSTEERTGSRGASTLEAQHVHEHQDGTVSLKFPGKSGVDWNVHVTDHAVAATVKDAAKGKGGADKLFNVSPQDVNGYIKTRTGANLSAKDFRTFHASRMVRENLQKIGPPHDKKGINDNIKAAIEKTAAVMGHTPAVCKSSYVNPRVLDEYMAAHTRAA